MDIVSVVITNTEKIIPLCDQLCFQIEIADSGCNFNTTIADMQIAYNSTVFGFSGSFPTSQVGITERIDMNDITYSNSELNFINICLDVKLFVQPTSDDIGFRIKHDQESTLDEQVTINPTGGTYDIFTYLDAAPLDIDLSAALANPSYNLVSAANACGSGSQNPIPQTILIDGEIEFDTDYCFDNSAGSLDHSIAFLPGAKITISNNSRIEIDNYTLRGCERIWKSITVDPGSELIIRNSIIQDAENAIDANSTALIVLNNNTFQNNITDLLFDDPGSIDANSSIRPNSFIGGSLKPHFDPLALLIDRSHISVIAKDQTSLSLSGLSIGFVSLQNSWENYNVGLLAENSNVDLNFTEFTNMGNLPPQNASQDLQQFGAVFAKSTTAHYLEMINSDFSLGIGGMNQVRRGVFAEKYSLMFKNQLVERAQMGVELRESYYRTIDISNNNISASSFCISSFGAQNFTGSIADNILNIDGDPLQSIAIKIDEMGFFYFLSWRIENNIINVFNARNGIGITGNKRIKITDNDIHFKSEGIQTKFGISVQGVDRVESTCNYVVSDHSNGVNAEDVGIIYQNAENSPVTCNYVDKTRINIKFKGEINSIDLATNQFGDNKYGLVLGDENAGNEDAIIGLQAHKGNLWIGTSGVINAVNSSVTNNTKSFSRISIFSVPTDGINDPFPAQLWPYSTFASQDPAWIERVLIQTPHEDCMTCEGKIGANGLIGGERGDPEYMEMLGQRAGFVGASALVLERLSSGGDLDDLNEELGQELIDDLILINQVELSISEGLSSVESGVLSTFWEALLEMDLSLPETWDEIDRLALASEINNEYEELVTTVSLDIAEQQLVAVEAIQTDVAKESVQYGYLKAYLIFLIEGKQVANDSEYIDKLRNLAQVCDNEGGRYVFLARNLFSYLTSEVAVPLECEEDGNISEPRFKEHSELSIYPNPVSEVLHIDLPSVYIEAVQIYDILGNLVVEKAGDVKTINATGLGAGTYTIIVSTSDETYVAKFLKI